MSFITFACFYNHNNVGMSNREEGINNGLEERCNLKICISPNAAETRGGMKLVDDGVNMAKELLISMKDKIKLIVFTDSRPLIESIVISNQVAEKVLRQSVAYLKQSLEQGEIIGYSWI